MVGEPAGGFVWEPTPSLRWFLQEAPVYASELLFNAPKTFHVNILKSLNPYPPTSHTLAAFPVTGVTRRDRIWFRLLVNTHIRW